MERVKSMEGFSMPRACCSHALHARRSPFLPLKMPACRLQPISYIYEYTCISEMGNVIYGLFVCFRKVHFELPSQW